MHKESMHCKYLRQKNVMHIIFVTNYLHEKEHQSHNTVNNVMLPKKNRDAILNINKHFISSEKHK